MLDLPQSAWAVRANGQATVKSSRTNEVLADSQRLFMDLSG